MLTISVACFAASASRIEEVETGLGPEIVFEGDTTWTIQERTEHYNVPGVSIAVISGFKVEWAKGYGFADRDSEQPVTTETLFQAASISKPTTGLAVLKCVEDGLISLDADVNTMLESWKLPENEFTDAEKVTVAHLLSHRAGVTVRGFPGYTTSDDLPTLIQILEGLPPANTAAIRVDMTPGTQWRYSGGGYCVLQQLLIDTLDKPFPELMKATVLEPLEMNHSTFEQPLSEALRGNAATACVRDGTLEDGKWHVYPEMAAAGLWTTPEDLAKMVIEVQLSLKGRSNRILSRQMQAKMLTRVGGDNVGLGFGISTRGTGKYFEHSGGNFGFASKAIGHFSDGYGAVVMTNGSAGRLLLGEILNSVARAYHWEGTPRKYRVAEVAPEVLDRYVGNFMMHPDAVISIRRDGDRMLVRHTSQAEEQIFPISEDTLVVKGRNERYTFPSNLAGPAPHVTFDRGGGGSQAARLLEDYVPPFELLHRGDISGAVAAYRRLRQQEPDTPAIREYRLNALGYNLLQKQKYDEAVALFRLNVEFYPEAPNTYDSLGEAYMLRGDKELAIANYERSLELNPDNQNAVEKLRELRGD